MPSHVLPEGPAPCFALFVEITAGLRDAGAFSDLDRHQRRARMARSLLLLYNASAVGGAARGCATNQRSEQRLRDAPSDGGQIHRDSRRALPHEGTCYGTFAPSDGNGHFPPLEQVRADFALMARSGFNTVRAYTVPSLAFLDEAARYGLRVVLVCPGRSTWRSWTTRD